MIYAHISRTSPRYRDWIDVVGTDRVPIVSPFPHRATAPGHEDGAQFYHLSLTALSDEQRGRLVAFLARRFGLDEADVAAELAAGAPVPLLADDLVVDLDARAFL